MITIQISDDPLELVSLDEAKETLTNNRLR